MKYIFFKVFIAVFDTLNVPMLNTEYSMIFDSAMAKYCFLDVDYVHTVNRNGADLIINPYVDMFDCYNCLGETFGNIHINSKLHGPTIINLSHIIYYDKALYTYIHEIGHFLGLPHSLDPCSIMYPEFSGDNIHLTRNDSLVLINAFIK